MNKIEITHKGDNGNVYVLHDCDGSQLFEGDRVEYKIYPEGIRYPFIKGICTLKRLHKAMGIGYSDIDGFIVPITNDFTKDERGRFVIRTIYVYKHNIFGFNEYVRKMKGDEYGLKKHSEKH